MNIWIILGIDKTLEENAIKKAYRQKLKVTRPEDDENAFMELRQAYEYALEYAKENAYEEDIYEDEWDEDLEEDLEVDLEEDLDDWKPSVIEIERARKRALLNEWSDAFWTIINDKEKISNGYAMHKFLTESIAYNLSFYDECKKIVKGMCLSNGKVYMAQEVWNELDGFFKLSMDDRLIGIQDNSGKVREYNNSIRYNGEIDFAAFGKGEIKDVQAFMKVYVEFMDKLIEGKGIKKEQSRLDNYKAEYIPYECIKVALCFEDLLAEEIDEKIKNLEGKYGKCVYTNLLRAQYNMFIGNSKVAEEILMDIYENVDTKNFYLIYQLAMCFKKIGRLYEGYLLIKHLTWLKPADYMVDMAQTMYEEASDKYNDNASDIEHILMARLRIRTYNVRKTAVKALAKVKDFSKYEWEYNMTKTLAMLEIYEGANAAENIEVLDNYDKSMINPIDMLEYKEIKARILFEAGKYEACINKCNEILEEYPMAYPILLLRAYADKELRAYNYYDLLWLNNNMGNRPEASLMLAFEIADLDGIEYYKEAVDYLEKYKTLCEAEYRYYNALSCQNDSVKYVKKIVSLCEFIRDNEVGMPDVMSHECGIGIETVYCKAVEVIDAFSSRQKEKSREYFKLMDTLKDTQYNNYSKYQNEIYLNIKSGEVNKSKIDADSIDYELLYKEKTSINNKLLVQTIRLQRNYEEFEKVIARIDYDRISWNNMFWLSGELSEYYLMRSNGEEALKWCWKRIDMLKENGYVYLYRYQLMFEVYARCITDKKELKKAIKLFEELTDLYGKYSDDYRECYIYVFISEIYVKLGNVKKALKTIDDMHKYSKNNAAKQRYHYDIYNIYILSEEYEKAYEHLLLYEKDNPDTLEGVREFTLLWKMGKYSEAADLLLSLDYVIGDGKDSDFRIVAAHSRFFENMEFDMDNIKEIYDVTLTNIEDEEAKGDNYAAMAEVCFYLDKLDEHEKYMQLFEEFEWPSAIQKMHTLYRIHTWKHIFKGEYQKAYEYLLSVDEVIVNEHFELSTLKYLLKKMV